MADRDLVHQPVSGQGRLGSGAVIYKPRLLPFEKQIIDLAGLTEDEYRFFVAEAYKRSRVRPAEYDHIPDIVNMPVPVALAFSLPLLAGGGGAAKGAAATAALVSLAVGVATTALAYFLMPKPKASQSATQNGGTQLNLASIQGGQRFSPTYGFDSQAELATYGDPIPIIFGRWTGTTGGMIVTPKLVWSRMFSYGRQQGVKMLFVVGEQGVAEGIPPDGIDPPPALQGIFLGNGALDAVYDETFAFYWKRNTTIIKPRIKAANLVYGTRGTLASGDPENFDDIFSCPTAISQNDSGFSAAHGLSNNAEFGCYSPIANGSHYRVNWRVISMPRNIGVEEDPGLNLSFERIKIAGQATLTNNQLESGYDVFATMLRTGMDGLGRNYSRRMGITALNGSTVSDSTGIEERFANVGDIATFTIAHNQIPENFYKGTDREVSVQDINDATTEERIAADDALQIGELFMIGRTTWQVISRSRAIWRSEDKADQVVQLKCIDVNAPATNKIGLVSNYMLRANYISDNNTPDKYNAGVAYYPLMKVAKATVRNTRPCEVTEIGIRSNVFQRLNGLCNFQNIPSPQQLENLDQRRVQISSGTNSSYIKRASVFTIFLRPAGVDASGNEYAWHPLGEQFCIIGNQPIEQYNYIRLEHPDAKQYEYQLIPKNGTDIGRNTPDTAQFWHLMHGGSIDNNAERQVLSGNYSTVYGTFRVSSVGTLVTKLDVQQNSEFRNLPSYQDRTTTNDRPTSVGIVNLLPDQEGSQTRVSSTEFVSWYTDPVFEYTEGRNGAFTWQLTQAMGIGSADNYPGNDGTTTVREYQHTVSGNRWYKVRYTLVKSALSPSHFSGQSFVWTIAEENVLESSSNWDSFSEFIVSFSVSGSNPFRNPPSSPTYTNIGQKRRVTGVITTDFVQGRSQAFYEELFGPARNYNVGTARTATVNVTSGSKTIRLLFNSVVDSATGHWSGQTRLWRAPILTVSDDPAVVTNNWQVGDTFTYQVTVSSENKYFRTPGTQVGANFVIEARGVTITQTYTYPGRTFEFQSQYADISLYGNLVEKSNANNPEHTVVYVNEITSNPTTPEYTNMTIAGLSLKASRNFTSLDQVRFWLKNGIPVKRFHPTEASEVKPSNLFCDLVYYMLTDRVAGAGDLLNMSVDNAPLINTADFTNTARFLKANNLFFDGAIASTVNIRQFIADTAPFMLCNFAISDGKFSLVPALPTTIGGDISTDPVTIKQLFTAGNIFEDSFELNYISAEERKDFQAIVRYREERENQLPQERNIVVRWNEGDSTEYPLESFDMTQYCTSRIHAELVARFFLSIRRRVTHSIQFKTSPYGIDLAPGDYIRVVTEANPYSAAQNGSISATGIITSATTFTDGQYNILYYKSGSEDVVDALMNVSGGVVQESELYNSVFTVVNPTVSQNVYQVEQLTLDADGVVQISATDFPCNDRLISEIALDVTNAARFTVDS